MQDITYATTNNFKVKSANAVLAEFNLELVPLPDKSIDVPEIQSSDQVIVAIDKAEKFYAALQRPLVVMDSGLFIEDLNGFPGVYTKYALETIGIEGLLRLTRDTDDKSAFTQRTVVYTDGEATKTFTSTCSGRILENERGENGRDYDKYFEVEGTGKTVAEMDDSQRSELSAEAWRQLGAWLEQRA